MYRRILSLILFVGSSAVTAAERVRIDRDTVFYVRPNGNNANSGLSDTKSGAWADPQYALDHVTDNFDFSRFQIKIKLSAGLWARPSGYTCKGAHVGRGPMVLEGAGDLTVIDGSAKGTAALSIENNCTIIIRYLSIAAGNYNGLVVTNRAQAHFAYVRWERVKFDHIFVSSGATVEQFGPDVIAGSATNHVSATHTGRFRNVSQPTRFVADASFTSYAYASSHGDVTYSYVDPNKKPTIDATGFKVEGRRCLADLNGTVQAASLGSDFFPGTIDCFSTTGGQIQQ